METEVRNFLQSRSLDKVLAKAEAPLLDDKEIQRVEIIILKYKSPEMEKDCVARIIELTQWPYKLNVFDNRGNGPNTAKIWNKLIRESTCDYILFMDSDAFVQGTIRNDDRVCWLSELMKSFRMYKDVAIVGPVCGTSATSTMQSMGPRNVDPHPIEGHLSGYCFLTKKSIYDEVGYFDEDFCFYGQESDWIERVNEQAKYKIILAPRVHVAHGYEKEGSVAATQAQKEGELSIDDDATYSHNLWNWKKQQRLLQKGIKYSFNYDRNP